MLWTDKDEPITGKETTTTSTDWVQVVRCKDCRFWERGHSYCPDIMRRTEENGFCAWGEVGDGANDEPYINPCRGCDDYDGHGGCVSQGGCGERKDDG